MISLPMPQLLFFATAIVCLILPVARLRAGLMMMTPVISMMLIWFYPHGSHVNIDVAGFTLMLMHVDKLSVIFGFIFSLAAFICGLYSWHVNDKVQQISTLFYAGCAIGVVFSGDLISLFIYWEGTALASVFLIWARRTEASYHTGMRYLIIQVLSGVLLLAGLLLYYQDTGSISFTKMTLSSAATWLIFLSFGIKCAFPLMHSWLQDAYPAATVTGTVVLSVFTTKMAIYAMARGFPGTELLIYIGAVMTLFPVFFAEIENDVRRVLSFSLNNQLGFMIVGIGIGTPLALNGTAAHAFCHILYKALLFMSVGAVLYRTGTTKLSELGGLYRTMPATMILCVVGAASISAFPLFSGFVSKSLVLDAAHIRGGWIVWGMLLVASVGVLCHSGIKVPFFTFFSHDSGKRPQEAPINMLLAMSICALLCIGIGLFPGLLYSILPYDVEFHPYTSSHVVAQLQLLCFAILSFCLLKKSGVYPEEIRAINLNTDWIYLRAAPVLYNSIFSIVTDVCKSLEQSLKMRISETMLILGKIFRPRGLLSKGLSINTTILIVTIMMSIILFMDLIYLG